MYYLNLTNNYTPFSILDEQIEYESFTFSGGEPHIKLDLTDIDENSDVGITIKIKSFNDLGLLMVAHNALRSKITGKLFLLLAYFPGARQDRRMVPGEPLTVQVYANIINSMNFNKVHIYDPHSDVAPALINNCNIISNATYVKFVVDKLIINKCSYLISPDAGSNKKILSLNKALDERFEIIQCDKDRDVKTGKIKSFKVHGVQDLNKKSCIIVDDICDGGGTFIGLAKKLQELNCGNLYLIVSHGIFSNGVDELSKYFKEIHCTESFTPLLNNNDVIVSPLFLY